MQLTDHNMKKENELIVNEIFYSIQGEGMNVGTPVIFIRLSGCNLDCTFCDTNHKDGNLMKLVDIEKELGKYNCRFICWTGGEPCMQLTEEITSWFTQKGYTQWIETNGTLPIPRGLHHITISPKQFYLIHPDNTYCDEMRIVVDASMDKIPFPTYTPEIKGAVFVSPAFNGNEPVQANIDKAVEFCKDSIFVRLSTQNHKFWKIT